MANRHKQFKKGGKIPPMDKEYKDVTSEDSHDKKGGKVSAKKKHGGMAHGGKSHKRMDKKARGGPVVKLKSGGGAYGGSPLSASSSKHPLSMASKVTSASK